MDRAAGPELAAAVTNAGGLGVVGGFGLAPQHLRTLVRLSALAVTARADSCGVDSRDQGRSKRQERAFRCGPVDSSGRRECS